MSKKQKGKEKEPEEDKGPTISERIAELLTKTKALNRALLVPKVEWDEKVALDAAIEFTRAIMLICPETMNKLREYVTAQDDKMNVNPHGQGVDMSDSKGGCWEHKQASYKKKVPRRNSNNAGYAHFIWKYPVRLQDESKRHYTDRILDEVKQLTDGGGIIFVISSATPAFKCTYKISAAFIQAYFAQVTEAKEMQACNIRCSMCKHCCRPHRLEYWQEYDRQFDTEPPTKREWIMLMSDSETMKEPCLLKSSSDSL